MKTTLDSPRLLRSGEIALSRGRTFHLEGRPGLQLGCASGRVWITQAGDSADYLLAPGQQLRFRAAGRIVVEALSDRAILWQGVRGASMS